MLVQHKINFIINLRSIFNEYNMARKIWGGGTVLLVKKSQLLKVNIVDNEKEIVDIPKILSEEKSRVKILKEGLGEKVVEREKRERKQKKFYGD